MHWPFLTNLAIAGVLGLDPIKVHLIVGNINYEFPVDLSTDHVIAQVIDGLRVRETP